MVVDTSALVAILLDEPEAERFGRAVADAAQAMLSAANYVELGFLARSRRRQSRAVEAFARYGKGNHPARLNFGDCFAYALAKERGKPLLLKGNGFARTDIHPAL